MDRQGREPEAMAVNRFPPTAAVDWATAPLSTAVAQYQRMHEVSLAQIAKAATQLGFIHHLEHDVRTALATGQPIPDLQIYVRRQLTRLAPQRQPQVKTVVAVVSR